MPISQRTGYENKNLRAPPKNVPKRGGRDPKARPGRPSFPPADGNRQRQGMLTIARPVPTPYCGTCVLPGIQHRQHTGTTLRTQRWGPSTLFRHIFPRPPLPAVAAPRLPRPSRLTNLGSALLAIHCDRCAAPVETTIDLYACVRASKFVLLCMNERGSTCMRACVRASLSCSA